MNGRDSSFDVFKIKDRSRLLSESKIGEFIEKLISTIDMRYGGMSSAVSGRFPNAVSGDVIAGVSVQKLMLESHIAVHTFPDNDHMHIVVSSCNEYELDVIFKLIREEFETNEILASSTVWYNRERLDILKAGILDKGIS